MMWAFVRWASLSLAAVVPIVWSLSAYADGTLSGELLLPNGTPIEGFPVIIQRGNAKNAMRPLPDVSSGQAKGAPPPPPDIKGENLDWIATTDAKGRFSVPNLPPGLYTVRPANEPPDKGKEIEIKQVTPEWWRLWGNSGRGQDFDAGIFKLDPFKF